MKKILLILIGLSVASQAVQTRFTRDGNIVTDTQTHLQWQDDADVSDISKKKSWQDAIDYCESLTLGGKDDWRLPNFNELYYIADRSTYNPALSNVFTNVTASGYWSSTTYGTTKSYAWIVNFTLGSDDSYAKSNSFFVSCVRAGR